MAAMMMIVFVVIAMRAGRVRLPRLRLRLRRIDGWRTRTG